MLLTHIFPKKLAQTNTVFKETLNSNSIQIAKSPIHLARTKIITQQFLRRTLVAVNPVNNNNNSNYKNSNYNNNNRSQIITWNRSNCS